MAGLREIHMISYNPGDGSKDSANKIQAASKSLNLLFKGPLYDVLSSRLLSWYMARAD